MLVILINVSTRERTPPSYLIFICTYFLTRHRILLFFPHIFQVTYVWQQHNKLEIIFLVCHPNIFMATPMKEFWQCVCCQTRVHMDWGLFFNATPQVPCNHRLAFILCAFAAFIFLKSFPKLQCIWPLTSIAVLVLKHRKSLMWTLNGVRNSNPV